MERKLSSQAYQMSLCMYCVSALSRLRVFTADLAHPDGPSPQLIETKWISMIVRYVLHEAIFGQLPRVRFRHLAVLT